MKTWSLEKRIRTLLSNHEGIRTQLPVTSIVGSDELQSILNSITTTINRSNENRNIHIYPMNTPHCRVYNEESGGYSMIEAEPFTYSSQTDLINNLTSRLVSGEEVYIYTIERYDIVSPSYFGVSSHYRLRGKFMNRPNLEVDYLDVDRELNVKRLNLVQRVDKMLRSNDELRHHGYDVMSNEDLSDTLNLIIDTYRDRTGNWDPHIYPMVLPSMMVFSDDNIQHIPITTESYYFNRLIDLCDDLVSRLMSNEELYIYQISGEVGRYVVRMGVVSRNTWGILPEYTETPKTKDWVVKNIKKLEL